MEVRFQELVFYQIRLRMINFMSFISSNQ